MNTTSQHPTGKRPGDASSLNQLIASAFGSETPTHDAKQRAAIALAAERTATPRVEPRVAGLRAAIDR